MGHESAQDLRASGLAGRGAGAGAGGGAGVLHLLGRALGLDGREGLGELERALRSQDLVTLSRAHPDSLAVQLGWPRGRCLRLAAVFAVGRRVECSRWLRGDSVRSPGGVYRLMQPRLRGLERETFHVLLLDGKHRLNAIERVSEGTLTTSLVHPREVFRRAVREAAAAVMVVHNHPSGDPEPSEEDLLVTRRLSEAGRLLGIPLLDHVVVGQGGYVSLRERRHL